MSSADIFTFHREEDLLDRLTDGVERMGREVIFVVGAPLTAPVIAGGQGVPDVGGVIELIRQHFSSDGKKLADLDARLAAASNKYQAAFSFLHGRRGQDGANAIVRQAIWMARREHVTGDIESEEEFTRLAEGDLESYEDELQGWSLSPAVESLGSLISSRQDIFGKSVITSNFDPLVEISIRKAGGRAWRTAFYLDGSLGLSQAQGCEVIHIHGYWLGSDTLHTGNQLLQHRPNLKASLTSLLSGKTVVVIAYGGWDDIFMQSLESLVSESGAFPEIVWVFRDHQPEIGQRLKTILSPGVARGRVTFYSGIDCHKFLPALAAEWNRRMLVVPEAEPRAPGPRRLHLTKLDCDRPPSVETWVGRSEELGILNDPMSRLVVICGIGGQGKSLLVAKYLELISAGGTDFSCWDWRDCREESDRLRSQVVAAIERVSDGSVPASQLVEATDADLVEVFIRVAGERRAVFVFDNVDHYIDLDRGKFVGLLDALARAFCRITTGSRIIITCRPTVRYEATSAVTLVMKGLSLSETSQLFALRSVGRIESELDIAAAHRMTDGHPFWLDLLAAHVARSSGKTLNTILEDVRRGREDAPDILSSIWSALGEREKYVLRAMAETVRPETEAMIERVVQGELNFQKFKRALKSLISLNLVVVKAEYNSTDLYDLHPLVRQFVKSRSPRPERLGVIKILLGHYEGMIRGFATMLGVHMPYALLERWPQRAELEIEAGLIEDAFSTLQQAHRALVGSGHNEEYIRVARKLFQHVDWEKDSNIKYFDDVFSHYIEELDDAEQWTDADDLLNRFLGTIPQRTARYIKFCDIRCRSYWTRGDFQSAVEWGKTGYDLKRKSDVDTPFDCRHNLALAMRDGGDPAGAIDLFLESKSLDDLLNETERDEDVNAPLHGNVGRCLFKMGRVDDAMKCFRVSALLLEDDDGAARLSNQAYAREWIGDAFELKGNLAEARAFFVSAEHILQRSLPVRARKIRVAIDRLSSIIAGREPDSSYAQSVVRRWLQQGSVN